MVKSLIGKDLFRETLEIAGSKNLSGCYEDKGEVVISVKIRSGKIQISNRLKNI